MIYIIQIVYALSKLNILSLYIVPIYWLRPGPVRDFGTERALAEPLGPNTTNFPSSCPRFTLLTQLNLSLKARPEAHTFDFITSEGECVCVFITGRNLPRRTKVRGFNRPNASKRQPSALRASVGLPPTPTSNMGSEMSLCTCDDQDRQADHRRRQTNTGNATSTPRQGGNRSDCRGG